ncbi:Cytochrome P450 [Mycena indigotica]|uniref:Cytochrome P450 n=1 Tax=Mycena indigotica TaxID=2126181 RepID=A0A8H6S2C9_9AGAR|nr:Cytochrome P450 [Mycena indigotica]KAF7291950.1 Cytochrome P450 [Mycena indigotica]
MTLYGSTDASWYRSKLQLRSPISLPLRHLFKRLLRLPPMPRLILTTLLTLIASFIVYSKRKRNRTAPPGPRGLPIIGNKHQIPKDRQWLQWAEWAKRYGDIIQISILGHPVIILSSYKAATDLLETRGNIYSDRPTAPMAGELVGWARGLGYTQTSNPRFREFRRLFHQFADSTPKLIRLLRKLIEDPDNFDAHARNCTSSSILSLTYGYPSNMGDPLGLVKIAENAMRGFSVASEPGRWWVDILPALKYLPAWFPGASFHIAARQMRDDLNLLYDVPYNFVKDAIVSGSSNPSFVSSYLEEKSGKETCDEEQLIQAFGASLYSGGAETTPSALCSFILAMALNPHVQDQAQAELDIVFCSNKSSALPTRLPTLADRDRLPYISALVKEVWRWNPSVPLGLPHVVTHDDEYRGYSIRKARGVSHFSSFAEVFLRALLSGPTAILHDEGIFPDPHVFEPRRYLGADSKPSATVVTAFGFGRRICPGLHVAENSVFIAIATILAMFRITKARDPEGKVLEPIVEYDGFICHPRPFKCKIELRSERHAELLDEDTVEA